MDLQMDVDTVFTLYIFFRYPEPPFEKSGIDDFFIL